MTDEPQTADEPRTIFTFDQQDEPADIWVDEVWVNSYGDQRAALKGDTYDAKDIIKFDWETTHHDWNDSMKAWVVDTDALEELGERLEDAGYVFDGGLGPAEEAPTLEDLAVFAEEGDDIHVEYRQKNGEGTNVKSGEVVLAEDLHVNFTRHSDGHHMGVKTDDHGKVGLFTSGSHAPFVGVVESVTVEADRPLPETDEEPEEPEPEAEEADLPW
jgi:hypothetical protein